MPSFKYVKDDLGIEYKIPVFGNNLFDLIDKPEEEKGDFGRGLKESFTQLPSLAYGLGAGALAGAEKLTGEGGITTAAKDTLIKKYQESEVEQQKESKLSDSLTYSWEKAKEGDYGALVDWVQHGFGYAGGQILQAIATGGVGSTLGKVAARTVAKDVAEGLVTKEAALLVGEGVATETAAKLATQKVAEKFATYGANIAIGASAFGMEGGEIFGDLTSEAKKEGRQLSGDELAKALFSAVGAGALEFVGDKLGADLVMGKGWGKSISKVAEEAPGMTGRLARGAVGAGIGIPTEAGTEYFQTGIEEYGKGKEAELLPWQQSEEAQRAAFDAAGLGALGGGFGGARGLLSSAKEKADVEPPIAVLNAKTVDEAVALTQQSIDSTPVIPEVAREESKPEEPKGVTPSEPSTGLLAMAQQPVNLGAGYEQTEPVPAVAESSGTASQFVEPTRPVDEQQVVIDALSEVKGLAGFKFELPDIQPVAMQESAAVQQTETPQVSVEQAGAEFQKTLELATGKIPQAAIDAAVDSVDVSLPPAQMYQEMSRNLIQAMQPVTQEAEAIPSSVATLSPIQQERQKLQVHKAVAQGLQEAPSSEQSTVVQPVEVAPAIKNSLTTETAPIQLVTAPSGKPFPTEQSAQRAIDVQELNDSHEVVAGPDGKGFIGAPVSEAVQAGISQGSKVPDKIVVSSRQAEIKALQKEIEELPPFSEEESALADTLNWKVSEDVKEAIDSGAMPVFKVTDHVSIAVHPSAQKEGMIQVSRYTKNGIVGDSQYKSVNEAIQSEGLALKTRLSEEEAKKVIGESIAGEAAYQEKKAGIHQSSQMPDEPQAPAPSKSAQKLRESAKLIRQKAEAEASRDRLANTPKRAGQAAQAIKEANKQVELSNTMENIANAIDAGEVTRLGKVSSRTQVEALDEALRDARYRAGRLEKISYTEELRRRELPPTDKDIDSAVIPRVYAQKMGLEDAYKALKDVDGYKRLANWAKAQADRAHDGQANFTNAEELAKASELVKAMDSVKKGSYALTSLKDSLATRRTLKNIGIEDSDSLRDALREYIGYRGAKVKEDPVKKLERGLVGKKVGIDFFPTPNDLSSRIAEIADIKPGMAVLEPSAGNGNLADAARSAGGKVDAVELSGDLREILTAKGHDIVGQDFTEYSPEKQYDRIVMNPPFSNRMDADHIQRAFGMLKPGGKLVAIAGEGVFFGSDKKAVAFRDWLDENNATVEKLPEGTFLDKTLPSTTGVNARLITIEKSQKPTAAQEKVGAGDEAQEPSTPQDVKQEITLADIPKGSLSTIQVDVDEMFSDGRIGKKTVSAKAALKEIDEEIDIYTKLLNCVKGIK